MTGLLYLTFLAVIQCGRDVEGFISRLETVKVQPGLSTTLECHISPDNQFHLFWIKIPFDSIPVCIATAQTSVQMCGQFENQSRITVTWNQQIFSLSFSSVEETDIATYFCGTSNYGVYFFGNGTKLVFEEHADEIKDNEDEDGKTSVFEYLVVALAATNVATLLIVIGFCYVLAKKRSGEVENVGDNKTEDLNYVALSFHNKQRRTVKKRTSEDAKVTYGTVQHQEEL